MPRPDHAHSHASVRNWYVVPAIVFSLLCCVGVVTAAMPVESTRVADMQTSDDGTLEERLAACANCHGKHGEGVTGSQYYPHLAGKPAGYLFAQMQAYRDGRRTNAQMD